MMQVIVPAFDASEVRELFVLGRPVPWKASRVGRGRDGKVHVKKDPTLVAWQTLVNLQARLACRGQGAFTGPVALYLGFHLEAEEGATPGDVVTRPILFDERLGRWHKGGKSIADLTNLGKAVEDALQGVVYVDDTQVRVKYEQCLWARPGGAGCRVIAAALSQAPGAVATPPCPGSTATPC